MTVKVDKNSEIMFFLLINTVLHYICYKNWVNFWFQVLHYRKKQSFVLCPLLKFYAFQELWADLYKNFVRICILLQDSDRILQELTRYPSQDYSGPSRSEWTDDNTVGSISL